MRALAHFLLNTLPTNPLLGRVHGRNPPDPVEDVPGHNQYNLWHRFSPSPPTLSRKKVLGGINSFVEF